MEIEKSLILLKGTFSPEETVDVLFSLVNEKIRFHNTRILGINEGLSGSRAFHENRLEELVHTREIISDFVKTAKTAGQDIAIDGIIDLKFAEKAVLI